MWSYNIFFFLLKQSLFPLCFISGYLQVSRILQHSGRFAVLKEITLCITRQPWKKSIRIVALVLQAAPLVETLNLKVYKLDLNNQISFFSHFLDGPTTWLTTVRLSYMFTILEVCTDFLQIWILNIIYCWVLVNMGERTLLAAIHRYVALVYILYPLVNNIITAT
jgi:hypothetical protein